MEFTEIKKALFWSKVKTTQTCWIWQGSRNNDNYGMFRGGTEVLAHRIAYQLINGPIEKGVQVLHKCDNPKCINPSHLFVYSPSLWLVTMESPDHSILLFQD